MKRRFEKLRVLLTEKLTLYPILTGILFLVNELRNNAIFYTLQENVSLMLIILAFTFGVDLLSRKLIKDKTKAALIATPFIMINLFYQDIFLILSGQRKLISFDNLISTSHPEVIIIPLILIVWLSFTFFILRTKRIRTGINIYFNLIFLAFILIEVTKAAIIPVPQIKLADNESFPVNTDLSPEQKPDIYYIILDSYTSSESLKKYWKYDNSGFEDSLKKIGFTIAPKSKADFALTEYCLASYLNSTSLLLDTAKHHYNERNLLQLIRNNRLYDWLNANKYNCYNFSLFDSFGTKKYYDFLPYNHFLGRTFWYINLLKFYHFLIPSSSISYTNLNIFHELDQLAAVRQNNPIFVYAHVMMPHTPYFFNEHGKPYKANSSLSDTQKYLGQLIFTDSLTLKTINYILSSSKRKPIIVIQGDHGCRSRIDLTKNEETLEAHTIFYALYTPYGTIIPDNINPSTTFKKVIERINH